MIRVVVRVIPRSSRNAIEGTGPDGVVRIRVTALPAGGEANAAVVKLLAKALGVPKSSLVLEAGHTARLKRFAVPLDQSDLERRLSGFPRSE